MIGVIIEAITKNWAGPWGWRSKERVISLAIPHYTPSCFTTGRLNTNEFFANFKVEKDTSLVLILDTGCMVRRTFLAGIFWYRHLFWREYWMWFPEPRTCIMALARRPRFSMSSSPWRSFTNDLCFCSATLLEYLVCRVETRTDCIMTAERTMRRANVRVECKCGRANKLIDIHDMHQCHLHSAFVRKVVYSMDGDWNSFWIVGSIRRRSTFWCFIIISILLVF